MRELADHIYGQSVYPVEELAEAHHILHRFLVPPYAWNPAVEGGYDTFLRAARNIRCKCCGGTDTLSFPGRQNPGKISRQ